MFMPIRGGKIWHDLQTRHDELVYKQVTSWGKTGSGHIQVDTANSFNKRVVFVYVFNMWTRLTYLGYKSIKFVIIA